MPKLSSILADKADLVEGKVPTQQLPETITTSENGKSAYELAVDERFIGTLQEWIDSLHGTDGTNGIDGDDGVTPVKGVDYFDGAKGDKGDPGSDATVTKPAVESVLTGEISTHTHAGGGGGLTQAQILTRQL